MSKVLVTGAGGFIGHHLVQRLKREGHTVRGVDLKVPEFAETVADEFVLLDLRRWENCLAATEGVDQVYALAADMGGMGFIGSNHALILHNNSLMDIHTLEAARVQGASRYLYASSACVYPQSKQIHADVAALKESDTYPADPQDAYGWEKLITERMCTHYREDYGLETRIVRFHNIYGPLGTWNGGREKVPAAICRKIAEQKSGGTIEVWGDGLQTRSFCYIDDCIEGIRRLMDSEFSEPLNVGSDEMVTINELVGLVADFAGKRIGIRHVDGPVGVRGRSSDNSLCLQTLGWQPSTKLSEGVSSTYSWIDEQVQRMSTNAA